MPDILAGMPLPLTPQAVWAQSQLSQLNLSGSTFVAGSPQVGVGFVAPPSGVVLCSIGGGVRDNTNDDRILMAPQVFVGSTGGAQFLAPSVTEYGFVSLNVASNYHYGSRISLIHDLSPGVTYFARVVHSVSGANASADITVREIVIAPVLNPPTGSDASDYVVPVPASQWDQSLESQLNQSPTENYSPGNPQVGVLFRPPVTGRVLLICGGGIRDNSGTSRGWLAPQIFRGSDENGLEVVTPSVVARGFGSAPEPGEYWYGSRLTLVEDLDHTKTHYARVMHQVESGSTTDFGIREIAVIPAA
jgi:hypothetical protein